MTLEVDTSLSARFSESGLGGEDDDPKNEARKPRVWHGEVGISVGGRIRFSADAS